uniref:Uncharacterized protein n=1 Tax=viral metagenome TaxID=1070528 RepID=A0A6H1ZKE2_9ZZZZ
MEIKKLKNFLIVAEDDNFPVQFQADTEEELKEKLYQWFKEEGFCDCYVWTKKQFLENLKANEIDLEDVDLEDEE